MAYSDYFSGPDVNWIKVADVKPGQILTIDTFEAFYFDGQGNKPGIRFRELPDQALILNKTNYTFFADNFGPEEFAWGGEKVAVKIEQVENPRKGQALQPGIRFAMPSKVETTATPKKK